MKLKHWDVSVLGNKPAHQKENMDFYTSDTNAHIRVRLTDELRPRTATFTLLNKDDGSLVSEVVEVRDNVATYHMRDEVINHSGEWHVQVVFHADGNLTTRVIQLIVGSYLLDGNLPRLEVIENWNVLQGQARDLIDSIQETQSEVAGVLLEVEGIPAEELLRKQNETKRERNETLRKSEEETRLDAEALRKSDEAERKSSEKARIKSEDARGTEETKRSQEETRRDESEERRKSTEGDRLLNESQRVGAEGERQTNETERESAEDTRKTSESVREANETKRLASENDRKVAEVARSESEGERTSAEVERKDSEAIRVQSQIEREAFDSELVNEEALRVEAEDKRETSEASRVFAESTRESSEADRQSFIIDLQDKLASGELDGSDLEYIWRGTELGVRKEGDSEYVYVNLKGETGEVENLDKQLITNALGFTPLDEQLYKDTTYTAGDNISIVDETISVVGQLGLTEAEVKKVKVDQATDADTVSGHTVAKSVPVDANFNDTVVDITGKADQVDLDNLQIQLTELLGESVVSENGHMGIRMWQEKFEHWNGIEWVEIETGGGPSIKVGNVTDLIADAKLGNKIDIAWGDPDDVVFEGATLAQWAGTQLRRKEGTYPIDETQGALIVDSTVRNQYSTGYEDTNLTEGTEYFYALFPYTESGQFTIDPANRASATAFNKCERTAPSAPTVKDVVLLKATVAGDSGSVVSLDQINWYSSPHTFTGLAEGTTYTPYSKVEETAEYYESAVVAGNSFTAIAKGTQPAPNAPTISALEFDRATVSGVTGTEVRLNSGVWHDSPHTFTGLTEETSYTAYARMKETATKLASPSSAGKTFVTEAETDPTTWSGIQDIVRKGLTNDFFTVGDQVQANYDGSPITFEVIGIDVDTPSDSQFTHSMTIQTKDCLHDVQFDSKEPGNPNAHRRDYGNNRYTHSAIKQWLNSNESSFTWRSQHSHDAKPDNSLVIYNGAGFLNRLDPELVSVLGNVKKDIALNTVTDGGGKETFTDKVFLLSRVEVGLGSEGTTTGEIVYPLYSGATNADRIKELNGSPRHWWLRSPNVTYSYIVRLVSTSGSLNSSGAQYTFGVSPACVII